MRSRWWPKLVAFALAALAVAGFLYALGEAQALPTGPVEITWDKEACAECHMHIGEPKFAAQIQTRSGSVLDFDDPGCLLRYEARNRPDEHAMYFHDVRSGRWLSKSETAFVETGPTPMGYGLGAVPKGTAGAMSYDEARAKVASRDATR